MVGWYRPGVDGFGCLNPGDYGGRVPRKELCPQPQGAAVVRLPRRDGRSRPGAALQGTGVLMVDFSRALHHLFDDEGGKR